MCDASVRKALFLQEGKQLQDDTLSCDPQYHGIGLRIVLINLRISPCGMLLQPSVLNLAAAIAVVAAVGVTQQPPQAHDLL